MSMARSLWLEGWSRVGAECAQTKLVRRYRAERRMHTFELG